MTETKKEFVTSENQHWYESPKNKGTYYPSVTTVLSIYPKGVGFDRYLANQTSFESSQEVLKKAGERGTRVHKATELLEDGETLVVEDYSSDEWVMLQGFIEWHRLYRPKLILKETSIISDDLKTGGTVDRVYVINDEMTVVDFKTSNKIHDSYWVQVAVYAKMLQEEQCLPIKNVSVLRLRTIGREKFEYLSMGEKLWKKEFALFKSLRAVWDAVNPNAKPRIIEVPLTLQLHEKHTATV